MLTPSFQYRLVSIIGNAESFPALEVPRRSLGRAIEDLGKLDYDNLPEAASRWKKVLTTSVNK